MSRLTEREGAVEEEDDFDDVPCESLERAEYVLSRIAAARRVRDEELAHLRLQRDRLDLLNEAARRRCQRVEDWFGPQLESFHAALLRDDPRRKTVDLLNGSLKARQGQPTWTFEDSFVEWAERSGRSDLVRVKVEPDRAAAKKALQVKDGAAVTLDGEVVPGVSVEPAVLTFSIEVA